MLNVSVVSYGFHETNRMHCIRVRIEAEAKAEEEMARRLETGAQTHTIELSKGSGIGEDDR